MFFSHQKSLLIRFALIITLLGGMFTVQPAQAETIGYTWAQSLGGPLSDYAGKTAIDETGNLYTIGTTTKGTGNQDISISKLDTNGGIVWSRELGASFWDEGRSIAVDESGYVFITGFFSETVDFDPGVGTSELTSAGFEDVFISKLSGNGDFIWAKRLGGAAPDWVYDMALDSSGNVYTIGRFFNTVDFDPGIGVYSLTPAGDEAMFISKLDNNGDFVWARSLDATHNIFGLSIAIDADGSIYTVGCFDDTVDFDPGIAVYNLMAQGGAYCNTFISKLDNNGNFVWARSMSGATDGGNEGNDIVVYSNDSIYVTGSFQGTVDFDPGLGIYNLTSLGAHDVFISKLDANGNFVWAESMGGTGGDTSFAITVDISGNIYATGFFQDTVDFDPSSEIFSLTSAGIEDVFVFKLNNSGRLTWAERTGSTASDEGQDIVLDSASNMYLTGIFQGTVDFDLGIGSTNLTSAGDYDIFITKLIDIPQIHYVKWNASGSNDGTSWEDAYTDLQSALAAASSGDEIWVAAGTYKPTSTTDRTISFTLKNGVAIYGGFAGTETSREQRNHAVNATILSGDIGNAGSTTDNSYHVVVGSNTNNSAILDGFTVTGGKTLEEASLSPEYVGGGMYNKYGSPSVENVIFTGNEAAFGGGMYNGGEFLHPETASYPILTNVIFENNSAMEGGGLFNENYVHATLNDVTFDDNTATRAGGGMEDRLGTLSLMNVEFKNNVSDGAAGAMQNLSVNASLTNVTFRGNSAVFGGAMINANFDPVLTNVTFHGNSAEVGGGMWNSDSNPILTNVTFSSNSASMYGGAIYNEINSHIAMRNTILWGNIAPEGAQIYHDDTSVPTVSDSVVQGGFAGGTNIITTTPLLGILGNYGGFTETIPLQAGSSAIDAGDTANCPATDQRGVARPQGVACDIGAYEYEGAIDAISPVVLSITRTNPNNTNAASVDFTVTFSEHVTGVDADDFELTATGVVGASVTSVSSSADTYTVSVNTGIGNGTIRLDVVDNDSIVDEAGNPLGGVGEGNGDFNAGEEYSIVKSAPKPGVPVLLSPASGALVNTLQPPLDWKGSSPAADHYQVQVSTNNTFTALVIDEADISTSDFTPATELDPGRRYYWRVKAFNALGGASGWSTVRNFRKPLAAPTPESPANDPSLLTDRPDFDWENVAGATNYVIQVSASPSFGTLLVNAMVNNSAYQMTKDLPQNKLLYWRVRAKTSVVTGGWSDMWWFTTGNPPSVPALVSPANNALLKDYTPLLNWYNATLPKPAGSTAFKYYQIQIDDDNDFSSPVIDEHTAEGDITDSDFTPASDLASNTRYYWRVRAFNDVGLDQHYSGWSVVRSFRTRVEAPLLLSPADGAAAGTRQPTFDWSDASGPGLIKSYTIQVSASPSFGTLLVNSNTVNSTYTMLKNLPTGKTLYWRVRVNGANGPSAWSTVFSFTTP